VFWKFSEREPALSATSQVLPKELLEVAGDNQPGCRCRLEVVEVVEQLAHGGVEVGSGTLVFDRHVTWYEQVHEAGTAGGEALGGSFESTDFLDFTSEDGEQVIPKDLTLGGLARVVRVLDRERRRSLTKRSLGEFHVLRVCGHCVRR
jgi:hypothetical protein